MKTSFKKRFLLAGGILGFVLALGVYLFWDAFLTSQFRTMQHPIPFSEFIESSGKIQLVTGGHLGDPFVMTDFTGLRDLHASGGNLVRFSDLQKKLSHFKGPKIIVDGMAEFHGYIKGIPTTFFAYQRKGPALKHLIRRLIVTGTTEIRPELVTSEADEAKKYGFDYKKINIGSKFIEINENIDDIVKFFDTQSENSWLHFHCARGKGRTSVLLVMFDILKNAPEVALKDIVQRQHLLGSENLFDTEVWKNGTYDKKMLEDRKTFIEHFYTFVSQRKAGGIQRWSAWQHSLNL